jgi:hypothetical protein
MRDAKELARIRRETLEHLRQRYPEGYCHMVSVPSCLFGMAGGLTIQMPLENAAGHLVEGTHRHATDAEIEAFRAQQAEARQRVLATVAADHGVIYVRGTDAR